MSQNDYVFSGLYRPMCGENIKQLTRTKVKKEVLNFSGRKFNNQSCMLVLNFINLLQCFNLIEFVLWCSGTLVTNL